MIHVIVRLKLLHSLIFLNVCDACMLTALLFEILAYKVRNDLFNYFILHVAMFNNDVNILKKIKF